MIELLMAFFSGGDDEGADGPSAARTMLQIGAMIFVVGLFVAVIIFA